MNGTELEVEMIRSNVSRAILSEKLNITKSALSKKINGINEFSRKDISIVKEVLKLSPLRIDEIFFTHKVDLKSTNISN